MTTDRTGEDRCVVDDLFHALSQPLTSLRCSMEVALLEQRTPEEYREVLEQSLGIAEHISELIGELRELWDAEEPDGSRNSASLQGCLDEIVGDLAPIAESEGKGIVLSNVPGDLRIDGQQTPKALCLLLRHAITICAAGGVVKVENLWPEPAVRISVPSGVSDQPGEHRRAALHRRLQMAIARRHLLASGCTCREQKLPRRWECEIRLPAEWEKRDQR